MALMKMFLALTVLSSSSLAASDPKAGLEALRALLLVTGVPIAAGKEKNS